MLLSILGIIFLITGFSYRNSIGFDFHTAQVGEGAGIIVLFVSVCIMMIVVGLTTRFTSDSDFFNYKLKQFPFKNEPFIALTLGLGVVLDWCVYHFSKWLYKSIKTYKKVKKENTRFNKKGYLECFNL